MISTKIDNFDIKSSVVGLWVFKSSRQRLFSVKIGEELAEHFKSLKKNLFQDIKQLTAYDAGAVHNKDCALTLNTEVATSNEIKHFLMQPIESRYVRSLSGLENNFAYIVTFKNQGKTLYAAKKYLQI